MTETGSRPMNFVPPIGDDVTASSQSDGVGHLKNVEKTMATPQIGDDKTVQDDRSGSEA